jgi:hypothetical protein
VGFRIHWLTTFEPLFELFELPWREYYRYPPLAGHLHTDSVSEFSRGMFWRVMTDLCRGALYEKNTDEVGDHVTQNILVSSTEGWVATALQIPDLVSFQRVRVDRSEHCCSCRDAAERSSDLYCGKREVTGGSGSGRECRRIARNAAILELTKRVRIWTRPGSVVLGLLIVAFIALAVR